MRKRSPEQHAAKTDTEEVLSEATAQALTQAPIALIGGLLTMPGSAAGALRASRILERNWPLAVLLVLIGGLFRPNGGTAVEGEDAGYHPNGLDHMPSTLRHRTYAARA